MPLALASRQRLRTWWQALLLAALAVLGGCSSLDYYGHLARGQLDLLQRREPIAEIVADPGRDPELRRRLQRVLELRRWAVERMGLPDNRSYTSYADLGRPFVLWNLFAAPELSVEPLEHCFPLAGCVAYRGYFDRARADREADALRRRGYDVELAGVPAYSTLNWFADPVLNTMMGGPEEVLLGIVLHELAHQRLYILDDTRFNESFAEFVEEEGLSQFLAERGGNLAAYRDFESRLNAVVTLALETRARLDRLYRSGLPAEAQRAGKAQLFANLREDYRRLRDGHWGGWRGFDPWFDRADANNARLAPFALYDGAVPAFRALFEREGRQWTRFFAAAERLGGLPEAERQAALAALAGQGK